MLIVGDTLIEPFWPTGSGIGRGFLSVLDAMWTARSWCTGDKEPLDILAERESVFKLLAQTTAKDQINQGLDPTTRYGKKTNMNAVLPFQVKDQFELLDNDGNKTQIESGKKTRRRRGISYLWISPR